jgi:hypothetical protein
MITKNKVKSMFFLDRDTDINELADEILRMKRSEILVFLQRQHERLQEKQPGEFFTVEDVLQLKDGELENMQRFFRGAVIPYFIRQKYNIWTPGLSSKDTEKGTEEIKRAVGFLKYDHTGHITEEVNSMSTFERCKDLNEFLNMIQVVCFDDEGFIFPDSEYFKKLLKEKGREAAQRQVIEELHEKVKNKHYKREIIN